MSQSKQEPFERRAQVLLQESAERLDGRTRSRLTQARHAALAALTTPHSRTGYWLMPAAGATAAAVLAVIFTLQPAHHVEQATQSVDEFEIIAAEDSLEFYRDVEFYVWLDSVLEEEPSEAGGA